MTDQEMSDMENLNYQVKKLSEKVALQAKIIERYMAINSNLELDLEQWRSFISVLRKAGFRRE